MPRARQHTGEKPEDRDEETRGERKEAISINFPQVEDGEKLGEKEKVMQVQSGQPPSIQKAHGWSKTEASIQK